MSHFTPFHRAVAFITVCTVSLSQQANAQFSVSYDFDDGSTTANRAAIVTGTGVTADTFVTSGSANISGSTDTGFLQVGNTGGDQAAALADLDYFEFTLNATSGEFLNLSTFTFDFGGTNTDSSAFTSNVVVQSSVGGFGTGNAILGVTPFSKLIPANSGSSIVTSQAVVDVSGIAFDNLTTVTFQIRYFDDATIGGTSQYNRLDNIDVNGSVIPEPSSYALLAGLAILATAVTRRRR